MRFRRNSPIAVPKRNRWRLVGWAVATLGSGLSLLLVYTVLMNHYAGLEVKRSYGEIFEERYGERETSDASIELQQLARQVGINLHMKKQDFERFTHDDGLWDFFGFFSRVSYRYQGPEVESPLWSFLESTTWAKRMRKGAVDGEFAGPAVLLHEILDPASDTIEQIEQTLRSGRVSWAGPCSEPRSRASR